MKRKLAVVLILALVFMLGSSCVMAGKPPKTMLDVTILKPENGHVVENGGTFTVEGTVLTRRGDAGLVETYIQYADEESTDFTNVDGTNLVILPGSGNQPQTKYLLEDESYNVSWSLSGSPGTYEIRILSQGSTAKSGTSDSRTVIILGPPPPEGIETIDDEYQDPETGYGKASVSCEATYRTDGTYQILSEELNTQGTKKPKDDTTEMGWFYVFDNLESPRSDTAFCLYGHTVFNNDFGMFAWADTDSAFFVQCFSSGSWKTILAITRHDSTDSLYRVDVPDDISSTIQLRIVDNDREAGNKEISSLYVDQAYIVFEPAHEYFIADLTGDVGWQSLKIGNIDTDPENEVVLGLAPNTESTMGLRYFEYSAGIWSEHIIDDNIGIHSLDIGDVDNDGQNEIWIALLRYEGGTWIPSLRYYEYGGDSWSYQDIAFLESPISAVTIGDIDNDGADEVVSASLPYDGYELRYYEYQSGSWLECNLDDSLGESHGIEIADVDGDNQKETIVLTTDQTGGSSLKYYKSDSGNFVRYDILNVPTGWEIDSGDVDGDGDMEIAWANYGASENEVRLYDCKSGVWSEQIVSDVPGGSIEISTFVHHVSIGDVDNDAVNEIAIGIFDDGWRGLSNDAVRYYEYDENTGNWIEHIVSDPDLTAEVVVIGDVDNDGANEILVGLNAWYSYSTQVPELRYYKING
ncbi:MAG: hypothetical protein ACFFEU_02165 [Candidatus Thorarchaeota archaeon]